MDVSQLFRAGVTVDGAPMPAATSTIYGTAVADSHDGTVLVEMDGDAVTQPAQESTTATLPASAFEGGTAALPSEPFPGTVRVYAEQADDDHLLDEEAYQVNGDRLTIEALAGGEPVGVEWSAHVAQVFTNEDFAGGAVQLEGEPANLSVTEDVGGASTPDWQPVAYELDGTTLAVAGMEPADGRVVATYTRTVEIVTDAGEQVLPDMPAADDVAVFGRTTDATNPPVEAVVTGWDLAGDLITIPAGYDTYTVIYTMPEAEEWNLTDQTDDEPLPDYDPGWDGGAQDADELEPEAVTVGHVLTYEPDAGTLAVTVDGAPATYTLDVQTVTVTATPAPERVLAVEYDAAQAMELPAAAFANGPVELPSVPNAGTVAVEVGGAPLDPSAFSVDDRALSIPGLVAGVSAYVVEYAEQLPVAAVELPTFPAVHEGDVVQITVVGGVPTVTAVQGAGDSVQTTLEDATTLAVDASTAADAAQEAAQNAEEIAAAVGQHVWDNTDGLHVTEAEKHAFLQTPAGRNILMNALGILIRDALTNRTVVSDDGLTVYDGQGNAATNIVANILRNLITLGYTNESHAEIDYHALRLIDKEGDAFLHVSDLRDTQGVAEVSETFDADGVNRSYTLALSAVSISAVTVDGVAAAYTQTSTGVRLTTTPTAGAVVAVTYTTDDQRAKAYTLGIRGAGNVGGMSVAQGYDNVASGLFSHAEGERTTASGKWSHAEGSDTVATRVNAHAEGGDTSATGSHSHAEGRYSSAAGYANHAEGYNTQTGNLDPTVYAAHAEGYETMANGRGSHAEGRGTHAGPHYSHAEGLGTIAHGEAQHVGGKYNNLWPGAVVIGNGTADDARSNALVVGWNGDVTASGNVSAANIDVTPTEEAVTLTNAGATTFSVRRARPICTLYVQQLNVASALASGANVSIGTIPDGYRPAHPITVPLNCNNNNSGKGVYLYITTTGAVSIYNRSGASMATNVNLYGCATWVL